MPNQTTCQARTGIYFSAPILFGYNLTVENARERARIRLAQFFERDDHPTQKEFAAKCGRTQTWAAKLLEHGPRLQDLDAIAAEIGMTSQEMIAPLRADECASDKPTTVVKRAVVGLSARLAELEREVASLRRSNDAAPADKGGPVRAPRNPRRRVS